MKHLILVIIGIISFFLVFPQVKETIPVNQSSHPNTYALVIGISNYESKALPSLRYAHRDAQEFASYLQSKGGGSVPPDNIRLLTNENATVAAIYGALSWLKENAARDDIVFFYFAGHGDMETETIYNLGYLLSYNTPRTNYINNALRIEDLNNFANTLSVTNNAKVVLITDACHSGNLAGSGFRGSFLVGEQLRKVKDKETRITSCAPDQLSAEDEGWGGQKRERDCCSVPSWPTQERMHVPRAYRVVEGSVMAFVCSE